MLDARYRLATYGTLAPGRSNAGQLHGLRGRWGSGTVRGHLLADGWGAAMGYPGIRLDPEAAAVAVHVFVSEDLPELWARLDAFEGPGYRRVETEVEADDGPVMAFIYELSE